MSFTFSLIWLLQSLTIANAGIFGARAPAVTPVGETACEYVLGALSFCESVSPGFTTLAPSMQAPCLCYSSTVWDPDPFDDYILTCAGYAQTALPADYSALVVLEGFCSSVGNVLTQPASASAHTTPPPSQSTATGVNLDSNPGCSFVFFALSYCISASPGFTTLASSLQAPCLCYSSTSWDPSPFDNAVATCAEYVSTAVPSDYPVVTALEGFCTSVGDVLSQPVSVPAHTTTTTPAHTTTPPAISTTPPPSQSTSAPAVQTTSAFKGGAESLARQDGLMMKWFLSMFSVVFSLLFQM